MGFASLVAVEVNELTEKTIGAAIKVHRELGPGLVEAVYEECLARTLTKMRIPYQRQLTCYIEFDGECLKQKAYRIDLLVENRLIVEIKSVEVMKPIYHKTTLTYMKFRRCSVGLLINFNVVLLKDGLRRLIRPDLSPDDDLKRKEW